MPETPENTAGTASETVITTIEPLDIPKPEERPYKAPGSQDELDRIIAARLDRERQKYADYDSVKQKAKKLDEIEAANQSELEKEQKAREAAEQRVAAATTRAVRAEIKALAVKFADPEDAVLNLGDLTRFVSNDGEIDEKAISAEIDAVLTRKPHLAKPEPTPEPRPGQPSRPTETLRPGAAPAEPERATNLYDAVAQALSPHS